MSYKMRMQEELTCKPLASFREVLAFLEDPPSWRTLCKEISPHLHSENIIRNADIHPNKSKCNLETPQTFCHFLPDADETERHTRKMLPKTLICHDMANGYHDDSNIDGTGNHDAYTFYNWGGIDIFCYFSHHFVTIPPLGWINVGHAHGVKVIGTVITEWGAGTEFWTQLFSSENNTQMFASALVLIAKTLKFDGWLLNIENKITEPSKLLEFVRHLHTALHEELVDPLLIWYDSVTVNGDLHWQNGLNEKNRAFFDVCDGIFTNYSWRESDITASVKAAGDRVVDVFVGIDVWGRNFFGGGQFNTCQAIDVAHEHGCSLAIFAPAWSHEAMDDNKDNAIEGAENLSTYEKFLLRDRALWGSIWPYLNTKLPAKLPFRSSFCRGQGVKRRLYGEVICPVPWYNLRHMQYQPNSIHGSHGYILSTIEFIRSASEGGQFKDKKGIMKLRDSFNADKSHRKPVKDETKSKTEDVDRDDERDNVIEKHDNNFNIEQPETAVDSNELPKENEKNTIKSRVRTAFNYLLGMTTSKFEENSIENQQTDEPDHFHKSDKTNTREKHSVGKIDEHSEGNLDEKAIPCNAESSSDRKKTLGQSMVQVPVNINLAKKPKVRFALAYMQEENHCLEPYYRDSYLGGSCLKIHPSDEVTVDHRTIRLFHCDFICKDTLIAVVVTKTLRFYEDQYLNIILHTRNDSGKNVKVCLIGHNDQQLYENGPSSIVNINPLNRPSNETMFKELQKYLLYNQPDFYVPVENAYDWKIRYYVVESFKSRILSINCRTGLSRGPILFGHFGLCEREV